MKKTIMSAILAFMLASCGGNDQDQEAVVPDNLYAVDRFTGAVDAESTFVTPYVNGKIYSFDERQSDYYANAGVYLGLIQRYKKGSIYNYKLSNLGKQIFKLPLRSRHLRVAELILSHSPFRQTLKSYIDNANIPSKWRHIYNKFASIFCNLKS